MFASSFKLCVRSLIVVLSTVLLASLFSSAVSAWPAVATETSIAADTDSDQDTGHESNTQESTDDKKQQPAPGIVGNLFTLMMLILLQAVLGFDNLLYISLESKHAPEDKRQSVRAWGIGLAIFLRIGLLFVLYYSRSFFEETAVLKLDSNFCKCNISLHSLIVLIGGAFIMYTAVKEIWHMTHLDHDDHDSESTKKRSVVSIISWIVVMNLVFSFDSILSAMALTNVLWVMTVAIIVSGILMIVLSDQVSSFLEKNRMYEVLGLFVLLIVGIMLISEGGHLAHLSFFGNEVQPMTKATFYFVLAVLVLIDIVQGRYQTKLMAERKLKASGHKSA